MASIRATPTRWEDAHIETMLHTLLPLKAQFGQGSNPKDTHFEEAQNAVNMAYGETQNVEKSVKSVQTKWLSVCSLYSYTLVQSSNEE